MGRSTFVTSVARVITFTILSLHQLVFTMPGGCVMRMSNWRRSVFLSARCRTGLSDRFRFTTCRTSPRRTGYQRRSTPGLGQAVRGCPPVPTAGRSGCHRLCHSGVCAGAGSLSAGHTRSAHYEKDCRRPARHASGLVRQSNPVRHLGTSLESHRQPDAWWTGRRSYRMLEMQWNNEGEV
jgi:hypothetical protein